MRPWVSREAYNGVLAQLEAIRAERRLDYQQWQEERRELIERIISMKRANFHPVEAFTPPPQEPTLPAVVEAALHGTGMDPHGAMMRQTARLALAWLSEGVDAKEVARRIERGAE